ncbi:MAG: hypothetical protein RLZZ205_1483, partial [Bacteroidota bacterium]
MMQVTNETTLKLPAQKVGSFFLDRYLYIMRLILFLSFVIISFCASAQSSLGALIASETNNDGIICYGENFSFNLLGNNSMPSDLSIPAVNYNPGVGIAIFLSPPSYTNNEFVTDPSFLGIFQTQAYNVLLNPFVFDFNNLIASIPPPFTGLSAPITLYFQAVTLYDIAINLPYVNVPGNPIDAAQSNTIALAIQPEIIITTNQNCLNNWIELSVAQSGMGNITFDISNTYPVSANFPIVINNQTTDNITNMSGNNVPFGMLITNPDGCFTSLNDNFLGTFTATLDPVGNICESDNPIVLLASPAGGTWTGNPQVLNNGTFTPSGVNINSNTIYTVVYTPPTPPGGCTVSASIDINVIPDANSQFTAPTAM